MKNFVQPGDTLTVTSPSGGALSGQPLLIGAFFGVAAHDAAQGLPLELVLKGVFTLPKVAGTAWTLGDPLYWDASAKALTKTVGDNVRVATAAADAASADVTGSAKIAPSGATLVGLIAPQTAIPDLGTTHIALSTTNTYTDAAVNAAVNTVLDILVAKINAELAALRGANLITD